MLNANTAAAESGPGIFTIDARHHRPGLAAVHLIVDGGEAAFVDTATSHCVPRLLEALAETGRQPGDVRWVLLTHIHLDHAGGAGELMKHLPHAELVVHPRGAPHMVDPAKLVAGTIATYGEATYRRLYGDIPPVDEARVRVVVDEETLPLGQRYLRFLDTPGHALHHHCILDEGHRVIFSGDTFGISYREFDTTQGVFIFPTTTPTHFDPDQAHASIDRLVALEPEVIYLTHFSGVTDIPRLAADLHGDLEAFVSLAHDSQGVGELAAQLGAHLRGRLVAHGCRLSATRMDELLAMDIQLNAKGLMHWLSRVSA